MADFMFSFLVGKKCMFIRTSGSDGNDRSPESQEVMSSEYLK